MIFNNAFCFCWLLSRIVSRNCKINSCFFFGNRLQSAEETSPTQPGWKQTYLYDRYGNQRFDTANGSTTTLPLNCATAVCNPQVDPKTNRLVGYVFDNAGNTKTDANGRTFIYDAENKQVEVRNAANTVVGEYTYDGDGKRVKKIVGNEVTVFVYDAAGKLVAEYANQTSSTPQVSYLTADHLGSPRINTDQNGVVISRHDYQPFGEEIQRTSYGNDDVRKQFTSYERDTESDLDFAQARYSNFSLGRFTSPDPLMASMRKSNPQTFNRYVYVGNNPTNIIDPLGLDWLRSNERGADGSYTYTDVYGKELKTLLKGKQYQRVDFGGASSSDILNKAGVAIFRIYAKGGGEALKTPSGPSGVQNLLGSFSNAVEQKLPVVLGAAGAGAAIGLTGGTILAAVPGLLPATVTTLGIGGADYVATHPAETEEVTEQVMQSAIQLSDSVLKNFGRFAKGVPANAKSSASLETLEDGSYRFTATSAARDVPGSRAVYEKIVDASGKTIGYFKTTFAPDGSIVHVKDKLK